MNGHDDIERLIHRYLDGDRSPDTIRMLTVRLDSDAEARVQFHRAMRLQAALQQKASSARHARTLRFPAQRRLWRPVLALAASLLAGLGLFVFLTTRAPGVAVARIERVSGPVHIGGVPVRAGKTLPLNEPVAVGPGARLVFGYDGEDTRITVAADTRFLLRTGPGRGKEVALDSGWLTAHIASQPARAPMRFATPYGQAAVLGTDLRLGVTPTMARVDVFEGRVRLTRAEDGETAEIEAGQTSVLGPDLVLKAYAADTDHVDGKLLFHDDFTGSLDHWIVEVLDSRPGEPDKSLLQRSFSPADTELARYIQHEPEAGTVVLDPGQINREVKLMLFSPPIPLSSIVMEYRTEYLKDYARPQSDHIEFSIWGQTGYDNSEGSKSESVRFPLGVAQRHSMEHIVRQDEKGRHHADVAFKVNDLLMTRHKTPLEWKPGENMMCSASTTGSKIRLLDFSVRRLVPLDPPPDFDRPDADASLLFRDDFGSGTLDRWHSATGDWRVVPRPDGQGYCLQLAWEANEPITPRILPRLDSLPPALEFSYDLRALPTQYKFGLWFHDPVTGGNVQARDIGPRTVPPSPFAPVYANEWVRHVFSVRHGRVLLRAYQDSRLLYEKEGELAGPFAAIGLAGFFVRQDSNLYLDNIVVRHLRETPASDKPREAYSRQNPR